MQVMTWHIYIRYKKEKSQKRQSTVLVRMVENSPRGRSCGGKVFTRGEEPSMETKKKHAVYLDGQFGRDGFGTSLYSCKSRH